MNFISRIWEFLGRLTGRSPWLATFVEDLPDKLHRRTVYLIGEDDCPWSAALKCPCGCDALIQLSLIPGDDPTWVASVGKRARASIHPSIWRIRGCKSHFFIREGKLIWAKEGRPRRGNTV